MFKSVSELWTSQDHGEWQCALASYWDVASVRRNLECEKVIDKLDSESIRDGDSESWLNFLRLYFAWKFTGNYLPKRLADLESNQPERLLRIKALLFSSDATDIRRAIERAQYIKGLGPAGGSGLLAVLFPTQFGTADKFVVKALVGVRALPERGQVRKMDPKGA